MTRKEIEKLEESLKAIQKLIEKSNLDKSEYYEISNSAYLLSRFLHKQWLKRYDIDMEFFKERFHKEIVLK